MDSTSGAIFSFQTSERYLASVPIRQPANPLGDDDAVVAEAVGDGEGPAVGFDAIGFAQDAEDADAEFFQGGRLGEDGESDV